MYSAVQNFHFALEVMCCSFPLSSMFKIFLLKDLQARFVHLTASSSQKDRGKRERHQTPLQVTLHPSTQSREGGKLGTLPKRHANKLK